MAHKKLFLSIVVLPIAMIMILAALMIFNNIRTFQDYYKEQIDYRETEYLSLYKKEIQDNVDTINTIIEYENKQIELELRQFLSSQLKTAINVASEIYKKYNGVLSREEVRQKVINQLERMRYNDGRGYFYIHDYDSNIVIGHTVKQFIGQDFTNKIDVHGNNIVAVQKASLKDSEIGFSTLYFNKPDDLTKEYPKLVCVTHFKPLGLFIGTGEYLDVVQERIQQKVLKQIAIINKSFGEKFIFIFKLHDINGGKQFASRILSPAVGIKVGGYIDSGFKDAKGYPYRETMLADLRKTGESYLTYWFPDHKTKEAKPKQSYFYWQKDWNWIIGCGFYYDQYDSEIQNIERIFKNISDRYLKINLMMIAGILLVVLVLSFILMSKLTMMVQKYLEQISELNTELERSSKAKSQFLANMSHEIRTPLHGVIGLNDILLNTPVTPIQREYLQKSKQASLALMSVINDILDYSKIEAGKLSIVESDFNLNELLDNLSDLFGFMIYEKGLEFCFRVDPEVPLILTGDAQRISQVLNNFVGNSVKFTHHGSISVLISQIEKTEDSVVVKFEVADTGIGISADGKEKIFQPFEQGDSSTTKVYGGTGLGLIISKQLIDMMGGELNFDSEQGKGSSFSFTITLGYNKDYQDEPIYNKQFSDARFLVVEDMPEQREYLVNILKSWHISPAHVTNGKEALELLMKEQFDYVMLDWKMPEMDGLSLLSELKARKIVIPNVLMITAYEKEDMDRQCIDLGISLDKILYKPYTPSTLFNILFDRQSFRCCEDLNKTIKLENTQKLLLVEDNLTNTLVAQNLFERIGFQVDTTVNGAEAVKKVSKHTYDIIFMDIQMPVMDGYEASRRIREFDTQTPIIALSAAVMQDDIKQSRAAGMNHHMAKPIDMKMLEAVIEQYFKVRRIEKAMPENVNLATVENINIEKLYSDIGDSAKVYQMLHSFKESHKNDLNAMDKMDINTQEFKNYIHKLKGSSGNLKMMKVYNLCRSIEGEIDHDRITAYTGELKELLGRVIFDINEKITPLLSDAQPDMTAEEYNGLVDSLVEAIDDSQLIKSSVVFAVVNYLNANDLAGRGDQIRQAFQQKDMKKLKELLLQN